MFSFTAKGIIAIMISIIIGLIFWFMLIPIFQQTTFLLGFPKIYEDLFDGILFSLLFFGAETISFRVLGGD